MAWIDGVEFALLDIDGTLLSLDRAIPGAAEALLRLRRSGVAFRLVSNTTRRSCAEVARALRDEGIAVAPDEVVLPAALARKRIVDSGRLDTALFVPESTHDDFEGVRAVERDPAWVVLGDLGPGFTWPTLNRAFRYLMDGASLLALHKNRYWRGSEEGFVLDAGAFVSALEYAAGVSAEVVGKPSTRFFELALEDLGAEASRTVMVGDNVETDGRGAAAAGCKTAMVLTGNMKRGDTPDGFSPDLVLDSVADLLG